MCCGKTVRGKLVSHEEIRNVSILARNTGGPNLSCQWAAMCEKKRVLDQRLTSACRREARAKKRTHGGKVHA